MYRRIASMPPAGLELSLSNMYMGPLQFYLRRYGYEIISTNASFFSLCWILREKKLLLHLHWPGSYYGSIFWPKFLLRATWFFTKLLILKLRGFKLAWTIHNLYPHGAEEVKCVRIHGLINRACRIALAHLSDVLIVHSRYSKEIVRELFFAKADRLSIIPTGSLIEWYPFNNLSKADARRKLNVSDESFVYLFFGRIEEYKGIENLISAFEKTYEESDLLVLVGKATEDLGRKLSSRPSRNIMMDLEFIEDKRLELYIKAADVVVLPYRHLLTSGVAIVALSFGKAIIAPNIAAFPEMLEDTQSILYDPDSLESLEGALSIAKKLDQSLAEEQALKKATTWQWDRIAQETARLFNSITGE